MKVIKRTLVPAVPQPTFDLVGLTMAEVTVLLCIVGRIGGSPELSARVVTGRIHSLLLRSGISTDGAWYKAVDASVVHGSGHIFFDDISSAWRDMLDSTKEPTT